MRILKYIFVCLICFFMFNISLFAETIVVENDEESTYIPTTIINGSFDEEPFMKYELDGILYEICPHGTTVKNADKIYYNPVDGGWNTTETKVWNSNLFEFSNGSGNHAILHNTTIPMTDKYVEMNGSSAALLYQDLTTYGNDVILWRLKHGMTTSGMNADKSIQNMRVEIGKPNMNDGNVVDAHGLGDNINSEIDLVTKAIYRYDGVTDSNGKTSKLGYAGSDIVNLYLTHPTNENGWYTASGIYIVPENQTVTRFGFISEAKVPNVGNLLDNIEFSTLIGNLNAVYNDDKTATVTGYWGEVDPTKKLIIKLGDNTYDLDMTGITGNFKFDISKEMIGKETYIEVYHEDYEQVKKEVKIVAGKVTKKIDTKSDVKLLSDDEVIINSLDDESINKIKHGEDVDISIEINNITKTIEEDKKQLFISKLNDFILGEIYDISLYKKLDSDEENVKVSELKEQLEFVIDLPNNLINNDVKRNYKILNYYNDNVEEIIPTFDKNTNTLVFKTSKLSKIAIIYQDVLGNPKTGDNYYMYLFTGIISLIGLICISVYSKREFIK